MKLVRLSYVTFRNALALSLVGLFLSVAHATAGDDASHPDIETFARQVQPMLAQQNMRPFCQHMSTQLGAVFPSNYGTGARLDGNTCLVTTLGARARVVFRDIRISTCDSNKCEFSYVVDCSNTGAILIEFCANIKDGSRSHGRYRWTAYLDDDRSVVRIDY